MRVSTEDARQLMDGLDEERMEHRLAADLLDAREQLAERTAAWKSACAAQAILARTVGGDAGKVAQEIADLRDELDASHDAFERTKKELATVRDRAREQEEALRQAALDFSYLRDAIERGDARHHLRQLTETHENRVRHALTTLIAPTKSHR